MGEGQTGTDAGERPVMKRLGKDMRSDINRKSYSDYEPSDGKLKVSDHTDKKEKEPGRPS